MVICREATGCKVEVEEHSVENVSEAVYLGVTLIVKLGEWKESWREELTPQ